MDCKLISFDSIAGIIPESSIHADVLKNFGEPDFVNYKSPEVCHGVNIRAKTLVSYYSKGLTFIYSGAEQIKSSAKVKAIVAEKGWSLRTSSGLFVGMPQNIAVEIIDYLYKAYWIGNDIVSLLPLKSDSNTTLSIGFELNALDYFNLSHR